MRSNIRQLRKQRNISQKVLGEQIGLSQQVVSRMERDRSKIQIDVLINLAKYFHVSTDCVLGYCNGGEKEEPANEEEPMLEEEEMNIEEMDDVEPSDRMKRQAVWQLLAELKGAVKKVL